MPARRPGNGVYVANNKDAEEFPLSHGDVATEDGFVGVAVKQKARSFADGMAVQAVIDEDEEYFLITKGVVTVDTVSGLAVGDDVWIIAEENKLTETKGENLPFGRVTEIAGERGCPEGKVRIDLDAKDGI